ncbi:MAG TPA: hypothetical protein VEY08_01285 [Chloroflexia bacterium]|nr:hypothetical protein [Chloroflexia bacterium]
MTANDPIKDERVFSSSGDNRLDHIEREEIHPASKQDVEVYIRTYSTMLRSSGEVKIKALVQAHLNADSALHVNARSTAPDMSAFFYCVQRLPACITQVRRVLLGQSSEVFARAGYDVEQWEQVHAPGRRRRSAWDGKENLAVYVSSASDVDDLIPTLTGFQIEWNKFHVLLNNEPNTRELIVAMRNAPPALYDEVVKVMQQRLIITPDSWERLEAIWGQGIWNYLLTMLENEKSFTVRMLGGSYVRYAQATEQWWQPVNQIMVEKDLHDRPVYFVSSNIHAMVNMLSGSILRASPEIEKFVERANDHEILGEYHKIKSGETRASLENLFYYASRRYYHETESGRKAQLSRSQEEAERGIYYVHSRQGMPIDAQVIELGRLNPEDFDSRLQLEGIERLKKSDAIILNIDYPLGLAAYYIFVQVAQSLENVQGVYVLGKAATLNGRIGDVMIPDSVFDEHSQNTYWLNNCFTASMVAPFLVYGSVLDNQKAVTVKGTYLQNRPYLDFYYRENYTVVEMEAGPYLNGLYEYTHPTRYPVNEHINFTSLPFDLGFLHYASDTPYTRGKNLGAIRLAYLGMDSAYATSVAILRHMFEMELQRIGDSDTPSPNGHKGKKRGDKAKEEGMVVGG